MTDQPRVSYASPSFREASWRDGATDGTDEVVPYCPTLLHALDEGASLDPETELTILPELEGRPDERLTLAELRDAARRFASGLAGVGVVPGDRVLLVLVDPREFLVAFFGTQFLGALPVPAYPPAGFRVESGLRRLEHIATDAGTEVCVTSRRVLPIVGDLAGRAPCLQRMVTVPALSEGMAAFDGLEVGGDDPAFIQYTSGSTGRPRGVVVTHHNLVCNVHAIGQAVEIRGDDAVMSWCPLYHDMGLIGGPLFAVYWRVPFTVLSPLSFLRSPGRWLKGIHRSRATLSPAPDFGFALAARRVPEEERRGLDLSSWRVAFNGAEVVNAATVEAFVDAYAPHGFRPEAMMPVYGLAEATLAVTFPSVETRARFETVDRDALARGRARPAPEGRMVASVGRPVPGQRVRVVDEDGEPVAERRVGRIQVTGSSIMRGYHGDPEATARVRDGAWLDTGDLGYLADGELFVTGRAKDVIIVRGRNYHAEDLERAAETLDDVRGGASAAFSVYEEDEGREWVVVVCEHRDMEPERAEELKEAVRTRVQEETTVTVDEVVLVERGTIPKTSSGKRQRGRCRERYLQGRLRPGGSGKLHLGRVLLRSLAGHVRLWLRRVAGRERAR